MYKDLANLDPSQFVIVPHVAVVDEFTASDEKGNPIAHIDDAVLTRIVDKMQQREAETGDLCPLVIGHTTKDTPETEQPPVVGFARSWHKGPLFDTGRNAAFADFWIYKIDVDRVRKHPRRSAEVRIRTSEIDPISLLGATTPARDLGILKLSRDGSLSYVSPGELEMPNDAGTDVNKLGELPIFKQLLDAVQQLTVMVQGLAGQGAGAAGATPAAGADAQAAGAGDPNGALSDEDLDKLIEQEFGGKGAKPGEDKKDDKEKGVKPAPAAEPEPEPSRKGDEPIQNSAGQPGGLNTDIAKLQRSHDELVIKLARHEVKGRLQEIKDKHGRDVNPDDENLVNLLVALPGDIRNQVQDYVLKLSRPNTLTQGSAGLDGALNSPAVGNGENRVITREQRDTIIQLARNEKITYDAARSKFFAQQPTTK